MTQTVGKFFLNKQIPKLIWFSNGISMKYQTFLELNVEPQNLKWALLNWGNKNVSQVDFASLNSYIYVHEEVLKQWFLVASPIKLYLCVNTAKVPYGSETPE